MAVFSGVTGTLTTTAGSPLNVRSWTVEETAGAATGGHSNAAGWTDAKAGRKAFTGSCSVYVDDAALPPLRAGEEGTVTFTDGSANTYVGAVVVTSVGYTNDIEGGELTSSTITFVGHGALTITLV